MAIHPQSLRGPRAPRGQAASLEDATPSATAIVEPVVVVPGWSIEPDAANAVTPHRRVDSEISLVDVAQMPVLGRASMGPRLASWQGNSSPRQGTPAAETDGLMANSMAASQDRLHEPSQGSWDGASDHRSGPSNGGYYSHPTSANSQQGFASLRSADDEGDDVEVLHQSANLSVDQFSYASSTPSFAQHPDRHSEKSFDSRTAFSVYQKGEGLAVSNLAPPVADKMQLRRSLMKVVHNLVAIIGGWLTLVFAMYLFKALAVKYNLALNDSQAEWIAAHQQSATQLFTLAGVLLSEICFILWERSIVYFAVRRLAYGRERTEVLTYVAWSELKRAGYTLSSRRKQWPIVTLMVWVASSFLAPAFTVWLTPSPMTHHHRISWPELDLLSTAFIDMSAYNVTEGQVYQIMNITQAEEICSPGMFLTTQNIEVVSSGRRVRTDLCPEYSNVNNLVSAGLVSVQAAQNESNALLRVGNITFQGNTGGVVPLGPYGLIPSGVWAKVPSGVRTPEGYDFTYELQQQGMSVEVNCTRPLPTQFPLINSTWLQNFPGYANVSFFCPSSVDKLYSSNLGVFSTSSVTTNVCVGLKGSVTNASFESLSALSDIDTSLISLWDFRADALPSNATWVQHRTNSTLLDGTQITSIGGPATCVARPYYADFYVVFNSTSNYFTSEEVPGTRSYTTGVNKAFWKSGSRYNTDYGAKQASARFAALYPGIQAMSHVFRSSNVITSALVDPTSPPANEEAITTANTLPVGSNTAVTVLGEYLLGRHGTSEISLSDIETFMKGAFEYTQTMKRLTYTYRLTNHEDGFNADNSAFARNISNGSWHAQTLGYGAGTITGDSSTQIVYYSLIPIVLFALMSWTLVAWSHYHDRPYGVANAAECDPTDLADCIVAASQGGLQGSFHRQALLKKGGGLKGARKVRIRLGQIYRKGEPDGLPQLGFVDVD